MLAQNFMTAKDLRIRDNEHAALITTLYALERGELDDKFDMDTWWAETPCGSIGCIAGWAWHFMRGRKISFDEFTMYATLDELFVPALGTYSINTAQAASALRNYLTHGKPMWEEVLIS